MAKRFIDTQLIDKKWYRKLSPKLKSVFIYMMLKCDHAGFLELDFEIMNMYTGEPVSENEFYAAFERRIKIIGNDKIWLTDFVAFQYGELRETNNAHKSVISLLKKRGAWEGLGCPLGGDQDMDKDKDMDMDLDKEKGKFKIAKELSSVSDQVVKQVLVRISPQAQQSWIKKYKDPEKISEHLRNAIDYYTSSEGVAIEDIENWGKKLVGWLRRQPHFDAMLPKTEDQWEKDFMKELETM